MWLNCLVRDEFVAFRHRFGAVVLCLNEVFDLFRVYYEFAQVASIILRLVIVPSVMMRTESELFDQM